MDLAKIISISGKPGLYKVIGQTKNGVIVEGIEDGKRFPAFASQQISAMADISIFTNEDDKPLIEVMESLYTLTEGKSAPDSKTDNADVAAYFEKVLPGYDKDRVYLSDIRKVYKWYNLLLEKGLISADTFKKENSEEATAIDSKTEVKEKAKKSKKTSSKIDKAKVLTPKTSSKAKAAKTSVVRKTQ
jgi:hypothetical protein